MALMTLSLMMIIMFPSPTLVLLSLLLITQFFNLTMFCVLFTSKEMCYMFPYFANTIISPLNFSPTFFIVKNLQMGALFVQGQSKGNMYEWQTSSTTLQPLTICYNSTEVI